MSETPQISIITANYNGARYLPAAIRSVARQSLASWELIIVDDASTDESARQAMEAAAGDPRIKIIVQNANRGPAAARNRALDIAAGQWLAVFDSDDLMLPSRLECLLERATRDNAAIVADNLLVFSEAARPQLFLSKPLSRTARWIDLAGFIASNSLYSRMPALGYLKPMIRMDIVHALGLRYDETLRIGEDCDFLARLMAHGHRLRLEPEAFYLYRKHASSISHRMRADHITALLDAADRFAQSTEGLGPTELTALRRRRRSLQSLFIYDAVIAALKRGDPTAALRLAAPHPHMWPLLTQPVTARLKRLAAAWLPPRGMPVRSLAMSDESLLAASAADLSRGTR